MRSTYFSMSLISIQEAWRRCAGRPPELLEALALHVLSSVVSVADEESLTGRHIRVQALISQTCRRRPSTTPCRPATPPLTCAPPSPASATLRTAPETDLASTTATLGKVHQTRRSGAPTRPIHCSLRIVPPDGLDLLDEVVLDRGLPPCPSARRGCRCGEEPPSAPAPATRRRRRRCAPMSSLSFSALRLPISSAVRQQRTAKNFHGTSRHRAS